MSSVKGKILFINGSLGKGGAERVASMLCNELSQIGYNVCLGLVLSTDQSYYLSNEVAILDLTEKKRNIISFFRWIIKIRRVIKTFNPDHIISFAGRINILTLLAAKKNTVIVSERNDPRYDNRGRLSFLMCKFLYSHRAKRVVFQTNEILNLFSNRIRKKGVVIRNPLSKPTIIKRDYSNNKVIVMVGRLEKQKNYELAIKAFAKVCSNQRMELHIFGKGKQLDSLTNLSKSLCISNFVKFMGVTDNPEKEMSDGAIFLLSSSYEGLSNSLIEAMSIGLPCISTPVAGANELIVNGTNGILLKSFSVDEMSLAILSLIRSEEKRRMIGQNAAESMKALYTEKIIAEWSKLLDDADYNL